MERILNDEEKIRRAEEIYYRRNNQNFSTIKKSKNKVSFKDKFLLHLIIMLNIAIIVFCVQNKDFVFTKDFLNTLNQYNNRATNNVINFFNGIMNEDLKKENNANLVENTETNSNQTIKEEDNNIKNTSETLEENNIETNNKLEISSSSINEMELDIKNLKAAYSFINPLEGIVSSTFGSRESKYQNVTGYHTGIDIAADAGKTIKASMQGIVELVSGEGDYGNHIKIRCNNVTTLYAHCQKIYVKEGQIVAQGQEIATVGSTGNSTGPHLHFEIRVEDRFVDPAQIVNFNKK